MTRPRRCSPSATPSCRPITRPSASAGALDFSDLIAKARNLLSRADAAQWVLYKLDRRVEHILVDEAQDTSPDQWLVVKAIAEDFFSGEGVRALDRARSSPSATTSSRSSASRAPSRACWSEMQRFFERKDREAKQAFVARPLFLSFRSTREVLDCRRHGVRERACGEITASTYEAHSLRTATDAPGHVVLLPRTVRQKTEEPEDWTAPYDAPSAAETHARRTDRRRDRADAAAPSLPSGKRLRDGEILILVRKRDAFAAAMNRALRTRRSRRPEPTASRSPRTSRCSIFSRSPM